MDCRVQLKKKKKVADDGVWVSADTKKVSVQAVDVFFPLNQWKENNKLMVSIKALIIKYYSNYETQKYLLALRASMTVK